MQKNCLGYPVEFAEDVFGASSVLFDALVAATGSEQPRVLIVADQNVVQRTEGLGSRIGRYVKDHGIRLAGSPVVIFGGEKIKTDGGQSVARVLAALVECQMGRNDCVLALGGGTLLDVAGYAAAQMCGGVGLVRLPTTPAAMIDAAFATQAALDFHDVKDALRLPSVPRAVVIDTSFAGTVLDGVWRGGFGEAVRLAVAADAPGLKKLFTLAEAYAKRDPTALAAIVERAVAIRQKKGGTTLGAWMAGRLESMSGYKLPHGYSVSIGLAVELGFAAATGAISEKDRAAVVGLLRGCGALDGLHHTRSLLGLTDQVLAGLDDERRLSGEDDVVVLDGLGKTKCEKAPDRALYARAMAAVVQPNSSQD